MISPLETSLAALLLALRVWRPITKHILTPSPPDGGLHSPRCIPTTDCSNVEQEFASTHPFFETCRNSTHYRKSFRKAPITPGVRPYMAAGVVESAVIGLSDCTPAHGVQVSIGGLARPACKSGAEDIWSLFRGEQETNLELCYATKGCDGGVLTEGERSCSDRTIASESRTDGNVESNGESTKTVELFGAAIAREQVSVPCFVSSSHHGERQ